MSKKKKYESFFESGFYPTKGLSNEMQTNIYLWLRKNESNFTNNNSLVVSAMFKFGISRNLQEDVLDFITLNSR